MSVIGWLVKAAAPAGIVLVALGVAMRVDAPVRPFSPIFGMLQEPSEPVAGGSLVVIDGQVMVRIE